MTDPPRGRDSAKSGVETEQPTGASPRRILHCDMDCFYAAIHVRDDRSLAGRPVLVGGLPGSRGVVAAANYEARKYGVRSAMPSSTAHRLCPQAVFLRPDFTLYREESSRIFDIFREVTDLVQAVSIDEAYLDVTDRLSEWGTATGVAAEIRRRVRSERGLTVSVGVGPNKLVAKIASDHDKPDGLTVVTPQRMRDFLAPLSVRALPGVGPATERRMRRLEIRTVEDLRRWSEAALSERFGRYGRTLHRYARGLDERRVATARGRKSLSTERTFAADLAGAAAIEREVERLVQRVAEGLAGKGLSARTLSVKVRYADFTTVTRAHSLPYATRDPETILRWARLLLRQTEAGRRPVRLLGVGSSNLTVDAGPGGQLGLFAA